jgi:hypothetical protein
VSGSSVVAAGPDAVRRWRVAAQGLAGGAAAAGSGPSGSGPSGSAGSGPSQVADVVRRVVGIQAQDGPAAALSIRPRASGLVAGDVDNALADGSIVLTWSLRGTRHHHARRDVRWLLGLCGPVFGRPGARARQLGVDGEVGERAVRALRRALEAEGPLTRAEVRSLLAPCGVDPAGQAPVHVLWRAACEGVLCVVPPGAGGEERYVLLDAWVPASESLVPDDPAAELARRYLAAFGPATRADLAAWSGLPAAVVRGAWEAVAGELVEVDGPVPLGALPGTIAPDPAPAPARLVGGYDTFLLGYADRSLHLPPEHARAVNAGGGIVRPVVFDDGRVTATWALRRPRRSDPGYEATVTSLPGAPAVDVSAELADVERFLGAPVRRVG